MVTKEKKAQEVAEDLLEQKGHVEIKDQMVTKD
jgi:hypothetical protein